MVKIINLFKNKLLIGVILSVIAGLLVNFIWDHWINVVNFLQITFKYLFQIILSVSNFAIPIYVLFIFLIIILTLMLMLKGKEKSNNSKFIEYISTEYENILYKWSYKPLKKGKHKILQIIPFCIKCECTLSGSECPICKTSYFDIKQRDYLIAVIRHNLAKNYGINEMSQIED